MVRFMLNGIPSAIGYPASDAAIHAAKPVADEQGISDRRNDAEDIDCVLAGDFSEMVRHKLAERFHPDTFAEIFDGGAIRSNINLMVDAISKINEGVYGGGASYSLMLDKKDLSDDPRFTHAMDVFDFNGLAPRISFLAWAHKAVFVMPCVYDNDRHVGRSFAFKLYTPAWFNLIPCKGNKGDWEAVELFEPHCDHEGKVIGELKTVWRAETWERWMRRGQDGRWEKNDEGKNPYQVVPGVLFSKDAPYSLWSYSYGQFLVESTVEINAAQSLLQFNSTGQIKMMVLSGGELDDMANKQRARQGAVLSTKGAATLQPIDLQTDVEKFANAFIKAEKQLVATMFDLPADEFDQTSTPPSGQALIMRYWKAHKLARSRRPFLVNGLEQLYWVAIAVLAVEIPRTGQDNPDEPGEKVEPVIGWESVADLPRYDANVKNIGDQPYKFSIDVNETDMPEMLEERQKREQYDVAEGYANKAEIYAAKYPGVTDPQAQIEENMRVNAEIAAKANVQPSLEVDRVIQQLSLTIQRLQPTGNQPASPQVQVLIGMAAEKLANVIASLPMQETPGAPRLPPVQVIEAEEPEEPEGAKPMPPGMEGKGKTEAEEMDDEEMPMDEGKIDEEAES